MLLEPPTHTEHSPAPGPADLGAELDSDLGSDLDANRGTGLRTGPVDRPGIPADLADLAARGRRDLGARRELADALLVRHWNPDLVADAVDMRAESVRALSRVRRPGTAAAHVAAELVPYPRTSR